MQKRKFVFWLRKVALEAVERMMSEADIKAYKQKDQIEALTDENTWVIVTHTTGNIEVMVGTGTFFNVMEKMRESGIPRRSILSMKSIKDMKVVAANANQ